MNQQLNPKFLIKFIYYRPQKIISYVKIKYKNIIIEKRNKNLCKNHTLASDVLFYFLKRNKNLKNINLVYLQPTSPQRNYNDIIRAARKYHSEKANSNKCM